MLWHSEGPCNFIQLAVAQCTLPQPQEMAHPVLWLAGKSHLLPKHHHQRPRKVLVQPQAVLCLQKASVQALRALSHEEALSKITILESWRKMARSFWNAPAQQILQSLGRPGMHLGARPLIHGPCVEEP